MKILFRGCVAVWVRRRGMTLTLQAMSSAASPRSVVCAVSVVCVDRRISNLHAFNSWGGFECLPLRQLTIMKLSDYVSAAAAMPFLPFIPIYPNASTTGCATVVLVENATFAKLVRATEANWRSWPTASCFFQVCRRARTHFERRPSDSVYSVMVLKRATYWRLWRRGFLLEHRGARS